MGITISAFLAIIASLVSIAAGTARLIQYFRESHKRNPLVIWGTLVAIIIVVIAAFVFAKIYSAANPHQPTLSFTVSSDSSTISSVSYVSPTPSAPPATLASGAYTNKNYVFVCSQCDEKIRITLASYTIDTNAGTMIWNLNLLNKTAGTCTNFFLDNLMLSSGNVAHSATGDITIQAGLTSSPNNYQISPGQSITVPVTFSFIPVAKIPYQLSTTFYVNEQGCGAYQAPYAQTITFP